MDWAEFMAEFPTPHSVTVEAYQGSGGYGDVYGAAVVVAPCIVDQTRRRVPVATADAAGHIVISSAQVYCPPGTVAPAGSRVTLASGVVTKVLASSTLDAGGLALPEHVELALE